MDGSRRKFLNGLLGIFSLGGLGALVYPVVRFLSPVPRKEQAVDSVVAAQVGDLKPNSGMLFKFGTKPGILVMTPAGEYRAFNAICTHLGCTVQYNEKDTQIWCACHNGFYDLNGNVVAGPPPRALEEYDVVIQKKDIIVARRA